MCAEEWEDEGRPEDELEPEPAELLRRRVRGGGENVGEGG